MSREHSEFRYQFTYHAPILPESVDNATAFFYGINQLIRSTPLETSETMTSDTRGFARWILDRGGFRIYDIVITIVRRGRRASVAVPNIGKG
jgi:hypothetical protein